MYKHFDAQIDSILSKMSLDDKIGQLNQICYSAKPDRVEGIKDMIRRGCVGSLILAESSTAGNDTNSVIDRAMLDEYQRIAVTESPSKIPFCKTSSERLPRSELKSARSARAKALIEARLPNRRGCGTW
jgi:hypothetical protein